jgi:tetratricopeptide (TPR) repeat protein
MGDRMTYTVAADETEPLGGGAMAAAWMEAAGRGGIPVAFIVNGAGRVAWIGHPMYIDEPLAEVVAGTWDVDAAAREYAHELRLKELTSEIGRKVTKAKMKHDLVGALAIIEEALASEPALEANFGLEKYFLLLEGGRRADASAYGRRLVADVYAKDAPRLNMLAWTIVDPEGRYENGDLALAVVAAERAVELQKGEDAATLDTLALALFKTGKFARAVQLQEKAVKLAEGGPLAEELARRLEEFRKARGSGDEDL